jgi:hypothetical protein
MKWLLAILMSLACISVQATLYENHVGSGTSHRSVDGGTVKFGQTFTVGAVATNEKFVLDSLSVNVNLLANRSVTFEIYALSAGLPTGSAISTGSIPADGLLYMQGRIVEMSSCALQASTSYAIVFYSTSTYTGLFQTMEDTPSGYSGGNSIYYDGGSWTAYSTYDLSFKLYGKHAPIILTQPVSITRCIGTSATFSVVVDSDSPTYQWRKGGSNIGGATSSSYTIGSVVSGSAGSYDCVVTESLLSTTTTSSAATLSVNTLASITGQPSSLSRCVGTSATFTVTATGDGVSYQWKKDGSNISATNPSYTISTVAVGDAGSYTCVLTGTCNQVTSDAAILTVTTIPVITTEPASASKTLGDNVTFSVTASGTVTGYQWSKDGSPIYLATNSTYSLTNLAYANAGTYTVLVTGTCGTDGSANAVLTVNFCGTTYSDNFDSYANSSDLGSSADWNSEAGAMIVIKPASDGKVSSNLGSSDDCVYYTTTVNNDQYSQVTVSNLTSYIYRGVAVRVKGDASGTYYSYYGSTTDSYLQKFVNGTATGFAVGSGFTNGDIIKLEVEGNELRCYKNGSLDVSISSDGKYTDTSSPLTSGYVGLSGYNNYSTGTMDTWSGGCGASVPPPASTGMKVLLHGKLRDHLLAEYRRNVFLRSTVSEPPIIPDENGIYFDASLGSDAGDGTVDAPYQTMAKLQALITNSTVSAGKTVYFKRGSVWNEVAIYFGGSGTAGSRITFDAYGTGASPLFKGTAIMTGFSQSGNIWTKHSTQIKHTYQTYINLYDGSSQYHEVRKSFLGNIFIDDVAYGLSRYPDAGSNAITFSSTTSLTTAYTSSPTFTSGVLAGAFLKITHTSWCHTFTKITSNTTTQLNFTYNDFNDGFRTTIVGNARGKVYNSTDPSVMNLNGEFRHDYTNQNIDIYWTSNLNSSVVEVPVVDSIFYFHNSSYVTVKNLEFKGSRSMGVMFRGGSNDSLVNCKITYAANDAVRLAGTTNTVIKKCEIAYADNGIATWKPVNLYATDNYIHKIALDEALGDLDGGSGNGIYIPYPVTDVHILRNYFDSLNFCALHFSFVKGASSPSFTVDNNYAEMWCMIRTDGGGLYTYGNDNNTQRYMRGNIGVNSGPTSSWMPDNTNLSPFIYLDESAGYVSVDSNTSVNSTGGIFQHFDVSHNSVTENHLMSFDRSGYVDAGIYYETIGGTADNLTMTNNEVVGTDNSSSLVGWNDYYSTLDCPSCDWNNNKYFNSLSSYNSYNFMNTWSPTYYTTIAAWRTKTGLEASSTLKFLSTLSATQVVAFVNFSNSVYVFQLGTGSFKDYAGTVVSGTVSVQPHKSVFLYLVSGSGWENPLHIVNPLQ